MKNALKNLFLGSYFRLAAFCVLLACLPLFIAIAVNELSLYRQREAFILDLAGEFSTTLNEHQQNIDRGVHDLLSGLGRTLWTQADASPDLLRQTLKLYNPAALADTLVLYSSAGEAVAWTGQGQPKSLPERTGALLKRGVVGDDLLITLADDANERIFALPLLNELGGVEFFLTAGLDFRRYLVWPRDMRIPISFSLFLHSPNGLWLPLEKTSPEANPKTSWLEKVLEQLPNSGHGACLLRHEGKTFLTAFINLVGQDPGQPDLFTLGLANYDQAFASAKYMARGSILRLVLVSASMLCVVIIACLYLFKKPLAGLLRLSDRLAAGDFTAIDELSKIKGVFAEYAHGLRDMAESLKKREQDLQNVRLASELAAQSKVEFFANTSHEIRTPMNAILGMTYLALKNTSSPQQASYLNKVQEAGKTLLHIAGDTLDFNNLTESEISMKDSLFSIRDVFSSISGNYRAEMRERDIRFALNVSQEVPMILMGDALRLEQALNQLVDNAVRHTRNGVLRLGCSLSGLARNDCALRITVADTGEGMRPEFLRLAQQLLSGDESHLLNWHEHGHGLGLLLAYRIIRMMRGEMSINSEPGRGTICSCIVHLGYQAESQHQTASLVEDKHVLLCDADSSSRLLHANLLNGFSMRVSIFEHVPPALSALVEADAQGDGYDFLILGWRNSTLDLEGIIRQIRERMRLEKIPKIIVTSSFSRSEVRYMVERFGADAFLPTPIQASLMLDALTLLNGAKGEDPYRENPADFAGLRVLLAEDNQLHQQIAASLMTAAQMEVCAVGNGSEALKALAAARRDRPFDMVLMDPQMPYMDGFESARRIRQDNYLGAGHIPIIALTAGRSSQELVACRKAGMDDYVLKPVDQGALFTVLRRWLPMHPDRSGQVGRFLRELYLRLKNDHAEAGAFFNKGGSALRRYAGVGRSEKLRLLIDEQQWDTAGSFIAHLLPYWPEATAAE
ncbi:MAG: response regulator [Desulfovibrionaceae bacterium]|nr:response regulator [Desulfovibrionaceae bacterium]